MSSGVVQQLSRRCGEISWRRWIKRWWKAIESGAAVPGVFSPVVRRRLQEIFSSAASLWCRRMIQYCESRRRMFTGSPQDSRTSTTQVSDRSRSRRCQPESSRRLK